MVSRVSYRPFEEDDFNELAKIVQATWHSKVPSPEFGYLEACYDLARCLSISSFSQVALIDGRPNGIALARSNHIHRRFVERWKRAKDDFARQLKNSDPKAAEHFLTSDEAMDRVNDELLQAAGLPAIYEITLVIVDEDARGLGIGSLLLDATYSYLTSHGAAAAYLYTDSECDWEFYEYRGFKRRGTHRATWEERKLQLPRELFLYEVDLTS